MFFLGILGFNSKSKELGRNIKFECVNCINDSSVLIEITRVFELFFIPIFNLSKFYILVCDNCKCIYHLKESSIDNIISNKKAEYKDIKQ